MREWNYINRMIVLACILLQGPFLRSQVINNEQDKKYTPNESSIFNILHKKNDNNTGSSIIQIKNSVKFSPTMLFRQKIYCEYEREIVDGLFFTAGIGKAFGSDFFQSAASLLDFSVIDNDGKTAAASEILSNSTYGASGPLLQVGLRLYYSGEAFDGGFVECKFRHETMDYDINGPINSYAIQGQKNATFKMNAFMFGYGYTVVSGKKNNITHEFFFNMGVKLFKYTRFDQVSISSSTTSNTYVYKRTNEELTFKIIPSLNMGYIFGIGF